MFFLDKSEGDLAVGPRRARSVTAKYDAFHRGRDGAAVRRTIGLPAGASTPGCIMTAGSDTVNGAATLSRASRSMMRAASSAVKVTSNRAC